MGTHRHHTEVEGESKVGSRRIHEVEEGTRLVLGREEIESRVEGERIGGSVVHVGGGIRRRGAVVDLVVVGCGVARGRWG